MSVKTNLDQVEELAAIGCTLQEIATVAGVSKRQQNSKALLKAIDRGRAHGVVALRRLQWNAARAGDITAQIWLGKQRLGQRSFDREEIDPLNQS